VSIPFVFDTNIIISGYLWNGKCRQAIKLIKSGNYVLLYSRETLDELTRVLSQKFHLEPFHIYRIIMDIQNMGMHIQISSKNCPVVEDETDNVFINLAIDGNARTIVSGDSHLLKLKRYETIEIVRASEFLDKSR
jgi:putative PIN family toxin of toxin-antitoxin system